MRMEDYFDMLQKAAARDAARKNNDATNGHDSTSNHESSGDEEIEESESNPPPASRR